MPSRNIIPVRRPVAVLYEDDQFVVFDKPSGLLVIPTPKNEPRTLVSVANQQYAQRGEPRSLHPCHRIDMDTSGVICFAKGKQAQRLMMGLFKSRQVAKTYLALVHGRMAKPQGEFRGLIPKSGPGRRGSQRPGVEALTRYKVLDSKKDFTIVEVRPVTGRTNQIRIHFAQAGHPLLGERKFAFARDYPLKFRRTALHAVSLAWTHPVTHQPVRVHADLPKDIAEFIANH